jgi:hypothetical protein
MNYTDGPNLITCAFKYEEGGSRVDYRDVMRDEFNCFNAGFQDVGSGP